MNIFITGAAGFIGREVVKQLLALGHHVLVYDDFSFGKKENLKEFKHNSKLAIVEGKIENHSELHKAMKRFQPRIVIHLAAMHFIPFCNAHPLETIRINVEGTGSLFEAAVKLNVKRVLFASSGAIYASEEHELDEFRDTPTPVDIYGISKLLGEHLCRYYTKRYGIESVAMRFFNTYGPFETNEHLIPEIMKQLRRGNALKLGNIKTKRDYVFTEDIARAIILLLLSTKLERFDVVNIGSGREYSAEEIVGALSKILHRQISINIDKSRIRHSDKMHQIASLERIKKYISWQPEYSLEKGLSTLLEFESLL